MITWDMFRKGEKVVYPRHGAGKIETIYTQELNNKKLKYYKIKFVDSKVSVSIPVNNAEELGLRKPLSKRKIRYALKKLYKRVKINRKTLMNLDTTSKDKLGSGKFEDVIDLVNTLKSLAKQKEEENKNFSYSYSDRLEIAEDFIKSEVEIVLGKNLLKRYDLF